MIHLQKTTMHNIIQHGWMQHSQILLTQKAMTTKFLTTDQFNLLIYPLFVAIPSI